MILDLQLTFWQVELGCLDDVHHEIQAKETQFDSLSMLKRKYLTMTFD